MTDTLLKPLLTPRDVARLMKVSVRTARRIMADNKPIWVGEQLRWTQGRLEKFVSRGGNEAKPQREKQQTPAKRTPSAPELIPIPTLLRDELRRGAKPRSEESLRAADAKLVSLGFEIRHEEDVVSYVKTYERCQVYADPRPANRIEFWVLGASGIQFTMPDTWNQFLLQKFRHSLARVAKIPRENLVEPRRLEAWAEHEHT